MVWYHYFSWTVSLLFSIPPLISSHYEGFKVFGFFYVNKHDEDANAFCWINLPGDFLTWPIWVLFFVPLIVIYIICVIILNFSYAKLKKGISRTFLPRMKLLVTNTVNMLSQLLYWFIVALFYIMTSVSVGSSHGSMLNKVLLFIIATKGFSSLFVWIIVGEHSYESKLEQEQTVDANQALREEVLQFATGGIRSAGRDGSKVTSDRKFIKRVPQKTNGNPTTKRMITPYFFMRFLLGLEEESKAIEDMVSCNRRSVNDSFDSQTLKREKFSIGTERLSQRATVPTGNRLTAFRGTIEEGGGGGDEDDDRFSTDSVRPSQLIDIEVQAALDKENKTDSSKLLQSRDLFFIKCLSFVFYS